MSRAAPRAPQAPSRVARRGFRARRGSSSRAHPSRRAFAAAAAAAAAAAEANLATPEANLLAWARADGLWLSDKVVVGAPAAGAPRGLIAASAIAEGEDVILLPNECTAFDASYATARGSGDVLADALADAVDAYASAPRRGGDVTDEIALALFVALAARHPDRTPFGAYVEALPREIPASPIFFPDRLLRDLLPALPLAFVDDVDAARLELDATWDVAAAVMDHVAPAEPELGVDEFARAWMAIRSRAIAFSVARRPSSSAASSASSASSSSSSSPPVAAAAAAASRRCAVPVVDLMNHACEAAPGDPSSVASYPGPAVRIETRDGAVAWVATRRVEKGEDVRWSYGAETSNETLWLWYGFVPDPPTHRGATATVQIPETTLRGALDAVAKDDDAGRRAARVNLLVRAGAFSSTSRRSPAPRRTRASSRSSPAAGDAGDEPEAFGTDEGGSERALRFDLRVGERPVALAGVAGLMCCSPEEAEAMDAVLAASFGGCVMDGFDEEEEEGEEGEEGAGSVARVDDAGRVKVRLAPESRRRAGKYVAFVLDQLEGIACGEDVGGGDEGGGDEGGGGGGGGGDAAAGGARRRDAFASARRLREGARAAFAHARANLDDETLLREGEWIDEAVARALAPY